MIESYQSLPTPPLVARVLTGIVGWAASRPEVRAVVLVGSYARGRPRPDSDVDVVLLVQDPTGFVTDHDWATAVGEIERTRVEEWGRVTSVRIWLADGLEVELGIAGTDWARLPLDEGTARVLRGGYRSLYDPDGILPAEASL